jgi:hypothetical protein
MKNVYFLFATVVTQLLFDCGILGAQWTKLNIPPGDYSITALATSGTNIFLGTSDGVFLSTNRGILWRSLSIRSADGSYTEAIAARGSSVFVVNERVGFLSKKSQIYSSSDTGQSWQVNKNEGIVGSVCALAMNGHEIFAGAETSRGYNKFTVYSSTNNGDDWSSISNSFPASSELKSIVVTDKHVFAGVARNLFFKRKPEIFKLNLDSKEWDVIDIGSDNGEILNLFANDSALYVITNEKILYNSDVEGVWRSKVAKFADSSRVIAFAVSDLYILAATESGALWCYPLAQILNDSSPLALQTAKKTFTERGLDQLGYTEEFFKAFQGLLIKGRNNEAFVILNQISTLTPQDIIATYVKLADIFTEMGDPGTSITILSRVLSNVPGNKEASEKLSQAYYSAGRYDEVIRVFGSNRDSEPMRYLGLAYEKKSMFIQANKVWQAIANSQQSDSLVNEANEHIRQNTIALMTTNQNQTKVEQASNPAQLQQPSAQQPTVQAVTSTRDRAPNTERPGSSEVDSDIPQAVEQHSNAVALILSIPQYQSSSIPEVKYAKNDAEVLRQYLIKSLGFKPENILPKIPDEQLTYGRIQTYIKSILPSYLKPDGSSDLFIYFTGHGAPSTINHEAYLVPWDGDPNYVNDNNSYSMKKFYVDVELLNARHKIIVVDACFSGYSGGGETLLKSASPIYLKLNNPLVADPNTVIFQSSSVSQVSNWYDEKKHSMFTYFFLKGLQGAADFNHDGTITADELMRYINDQNEGLPYWSNRLYQRPQEAQLEGNGQTVIERIEK